MRKHYQDLKIWTIDHLADCMKDLYQILLFFVVKKKKKKDHYQMDDPDYDWSKTVEMELQIG